MGALEGKRTLVILAIVLISSVALAKRRSRCEKIKIPFCKGLGYNTTIFPNNLDHDTQDEAQTSAHEMKVLADTECSPEISLFLCSLYAPVCTQMGKALPPCRALCQTSRRGCEGLMNKFGYNWPERFECQKFPKHGLCVGRNSSATSPQTKKLKPGKRISAHKLRQKRCAKESEEAKLCCKLGRRAAKKGYLCNLRNKVDEDSRKAIKFRKTVIRKCSRHSSCFRSCCEVFQRKRRNSKRNTNQSKRKD